MLESHRNAGIGWRVKPTIQWGLGQYSQHFIFFVTYECAQYAGVFVPDRLFEPSLMIASKARSLPESTWKVLYLVRLQPYSQTSLERSARVKHSSLLGPFVSYVENKVLWIWACTLMLFTVIIDNVMSGMDEIGKRRQFNEKKWYRAVRDLGFLRDELDLDMLV